MVGKKEKYLAAAQKFIERGQLDKALGEFAKVVQEDPKDTRTLLKMAELHAKRGANAEATEIYLRTGDLYGEQGFAQKAVAVYKNVLKLSPGAVPARLKLGALFKQLGLVSDAVQQWELAATDLQRLDKPTEVVAALRLAVEAQPDNVVLRVKLAESASQARLTDEAVKEFAKAADQLKAQGRSDESLRVVERLLFLQPDNFVKARELAEVYIAKGSPRLALPKLQACLNGDPRDPQTLSLLAKALEQLGQVQKAVSVLKELVRLCVELGRASERDAAILRGLTLDPTDRELRAIAAQHHLRGAAGAGGEATPPPVDVRDTVAPGGSFDLSGAVRVPTGASGRVVASVGAPDSGVRSLSTGASAGAGPDISRILAEADVFVKYGLLERAVDHLGRVFDFDPEAREVREKLVTVLQRLGRKEDAARHLDVLARQISRTSPDDARRFAEKAVLLDPDVGKTREAQASPQQRSPGVPLDVGDDPSASVLTPLPARLPEAEEESSAGFETDFDVEVGTGDIPGEAEVVLDSAIDDVTEGWVDEETPPPSLTARTPVPATPVPPRPPVAARTPVPMTPFPARTPVVVARPRGATATHENDDNDPASAFSDSPATISTGAEQLDAAFAQIDEDELSAELDQVTFFIAQALSDDARALLHDLEKRFPGHRRLAAMWLELEASEALLDAPTPEAGGSSTDSERSAVRATYIEGPSRSSDATPTPRVDQVDGNAPDFLTYADLAIAYKEMGLFDAAIGELKLLCQDPKREVFALTMIGECFEAKASFTEAVIRYKRALNCPVVTREETLLLYFLLGAAFERLGDINEALYFFEKVAKRDPKFRDVDQKIAELKPQMAKRAR